MDNYEKIIIEAFLNVGVFIDEEEDIKELLLSDLLEDSLAFIAFIVELEQSLGIEIPEEYLLQGKLESVADVEAMIGMLCG